MAQLNTSEPNYQFAFRKRAGVSRMSKHSLKVDMTPMVDLGFLLISFFVFTAELNKPAAITLAMTKDGPPMDLAESAAISFLIDKGNTVFYYEGKWDEAVKANRVLRVQVNGKDNIRKIINRKQRRLEGNPGFKEGKNGLMMLIKPGKESNYKTIVNLLDEATINQVKKYAVVKPTAEELVWLSRHQDTGF